MEEKTKTKLARITLKLTILSLIAIYLVTTLHGVYAQQLELANTFGNILDQEQPELILQPNQQLPIQPVLSIEEMIINKASQYGVEADLMLKIAICESGLNPKATNNQGSSASGIFQFTIGTWEDGNRWRGTNWSLDDRFDPAKNIDMAGYFMGNRGEIERWECLHLIN